MYFSSYIFCQERKLLNETFGMRENLTTFQFLSSMHCSGVNELTSSCKPSGVKTWASLTIRFVHPLTLAHYSLGESHPTNKRMGSVRPRKESIPRAFRIVLRTLDENKSWTVLFGCCVCVTLPLRHHRRDPQLPIRFDLPLRR